MEGGEKKKASIKKRPVKCLNTKLLVLEGEKYLPLALITFLKKRNKILVIIFILGKIYKSYRPQKDSKLSSD